MKSKIYIKSRKVKNWKARLNIDGLRTTKRVHYDQNYTPVASYKSIRMLLTTTAVQGCHTQHLDYVLAFPQAPVELDLYMKVPKGFEIEGGNEDDYVLKIHQNIYGQKQSGRVWNQYLVLKLVNVLGFKQSTVDK